MLADQIFSPKHVAFFEASLVYDVGRNFFAQHHLAQITQHYNPAVWQLVAVCYSDKESSALASLELPIERLGHDLSLPEDKRQSTVAELLAFADSAHLSYLPKLQQLASRRLELPCIEHPKTFVSVLNALQQMPAAWSRELVFRTIRDHTTLV